jgi:hypothetical protein
LNDDHPGEIIASSKSSMNVSAAVSGRVPVPAQTPVVGRPPLEPLELPLPDEPLEVAVPDEPLEVLAPDELLAVESPVDPES